MPKGYTLDADMQMKIEDERAGRLDHVYETDLSIADAFDRLKAKPDLGIRYETVTKDGILYIDFFDDRLNDGLHSESPIRYAVRFESDNRLTIIRVRYIWDMKPYLFKKDVDDFFTQMFDARISDREKIIWIDGTDHFTASDPLKIHGSRYFWIIALIFILVWLLMIFAAR